MHDPLPVSAGTEERRARYLEVRRNLDALLMGEDNWVAALSTVTCELHHAFDYFHWTGFYRVIAPRLLAVGPYQGTHGCLRIDFDRGACGAAARQRRTLRLDDVHAFPDHLACSATTRSEIVVPVLAPDGRLLAVLDVDSDVPAAFTAVDEEQLEAACADLSRRSSAWEREPSPGAP